MAVEGPDMLKFGPQCWCGDAGIGMGAGIPSLLWLATQCCIINRPVSGEHLGESIKAIIQSSINFQQDTRIICVVLYDNVSVWPQHLSVTTLRVVRVNERLTVIKAFPFVQDVHIVAMEVYWLDWV